MDKAPERVGKYEIIEVIGQGAMGVVYKARAPLMNRVVALKKLSLGPMLTGDRGEEFKARFLREANAAGNLKHANIVTIYDVDLADGVPFMAMEFLEGGSLATWMKSNGATPLPRAAALVRAVGLGLAYAHWRGIVHRDIKPDNILLDRDGRPVITDFGAAHLQDSELTVTGEVLGTPHYMSPEQVLCEPIDNRSDLFALGVVFYLLVTGKRPFKGDTISSVCYHIVHSPPEPLPKDLPEIQAVVPVLEKLLAKRREDRFATGGELAAARLGQLTASASPSDGPALERAKGALSRAKSSSQQALTSWAKPILDRSIAAYTEATDHINTDEDAIIQAYADAYPALQLKGRLPPDLAQAAESFVQGCRENLNDDEWARAEAAAQGKQNP